MMKGSSEQGRVAVNDEVLKRMMKNTSKWERIVVNDGG